MPTPNPTSLPRLSDRYAVGVRAAYVILIFLVWFAHPVRGAGGAAAASGAH